MNEFPGFCDCPAPSGGVWPVVVLTAAFGLFLLGRWLWWKFALKGWLNMNRVMKIVAVVGLVLAVGVVLAMKNSGEVPLPDVRSTAGSDEAKAGASTDAPLPRLVSLGAGKCIPCKMMEPIREELRAEYAGRLKVVYHDVWHDQQIGEQYGIRLIPTLIYFDAEGNELGRTEGYKTKQQIIDAFADWGVDLNEVATGDAFGAASSGAAMPGDLRIQFAAAPAQNAAPSQAPLTTLGDVYPLLGDGPLGKAKLSALPDGQLMQAGDVVVQTTDVTAMIDDAPPHVQAQLKQHQLFLLEQLATQRLVAAKARTTVVDKPGEPMTDDQVIERYLRSVAEGVKISDEDIRQFYQNNSAMMGGEPLAQVKEQIRQYLMGQARQAHVSQHVETLVRQANFQLDEQWGRTQAQAALDNPVDRTRAGGKPAMIDFGSHGCGPCDMMTPILERLANTYDGRAVVLFVPVNEHQILAARYRVQGIPTQIFFDAKGREVFRHTGFLAQDKIEAQFAEMGVR